MKYLPFVKPALLGALLVFSPITPAAFAETVGVMILNTRGDDGIYRPALRIVRGGTVTYIAAGQQGLTEAILRDASQLGTWLGENVDVAEGGEPITFTITEERADPPEPEAEPEPTITDCDTTKCTKDEYELWCKATNGPGCA